MGDEVASQKHLADTAGSGLSGSADASLAFHLSRRTSVALVTVHISGHNAGRKGHGPSQNPFAAGSSYAFEWESARAAGAASRTLFLTSEECNE
jgi:hypothetical protein